MMGFGASALVLGNWASSMFEGAMGWRRTYVILGLALGAVLILYDKSRHEILNDAEKEQVFQDIFQWISSKIL